MRAREGTANAAGALAPSWLFRANPSIVQPGARRAGQGWVIAWSNFSRRSPASGVLTVELRNAASLRLIGAAVLVAAWLAYPATAAPAGSIEYEIKATYLYKFVPFVDWPQSAAAAFNLCIVGDDPVAAAIDQAAKGQTIAGKPLVVKHLPAAVPDAGCQVMYLAGTDAQTVAQALAAMKGAPVLTVTDEASHPADRGIVSFVIDANHVRFDIDDAAAAQDGLVISSKLLGLAHSVKPRGAEAHGG